MGKNREPRDSERLANASGDGFDLLEVGPDDGSDLLEFEDSGELHARIKVVGCGGAGGNALDTMIRAGLSGVEFVAANTDAQALEHKLAPIKIQLGPQVTRGLGCGANPEKGRAAALEDRDKLRDMLIGSDMVFITAGLGGGTGTGAAPVIAEVAREIGALTVAVVTKPFPFEGRQRTKHAEQGLEELHRVVDTLITIPNQRLLALAGKDTPMTAAFTLADDVLVNAVRGISDLITVHGLINLDFADVRTIMNEMGMALMGTGAASGENRAQDAAYAAISSPLLEDVSIDGARGVLINITGGPDMTLYEVNEASTLVQEAAHEEANIIFGAVIDETVSEGEIRVTVIATGLDDGRVRVGERTPARESLTELRPLDMPAAAAADVAAPPPAAELTTEAVPLVTEPLRPAAEQGTSPDEFVSPFEDELDVPTFLRKRRQAGLPQEDEDDREAPAFLRRSAD
ncbi:MAG: cell division protein FtsZ [Deltaproteobacteria bacterium]|nr:cell division protein FtsZ [Deltaproteobacteria bacterium]MBW2361464.1 cell division protein FtsZ [Deltaproteobacteria bacterium]